MCYILEVFDHLSSWPGFDFPLHCRKLQNMCLKNAAVLLRNSYKMPRIVCTICIVWLNTYKKQKCILLLLVLVPSSVPGITLFWLHTIYWTLFPILSCHCIALHCIAHYQSSSRSSVQPGCSLGAVPRDRLEAYWQGHKTGMASG